MCCEGSESGEPLSPSLLSFVCLCALAASPLSILPPGGGFLWPSIPAWWPSSHSLPMLHLAPARKGCWMWSPDLCPGPPHPTAKASGVGFLCFYQAWLGEGQLCSIWGLQLHLLTPFDPEVLPVGENVCEGWAAPCTCVGGMPWLAYLGLQALSVLGGLTQAGLHPGVLPASVGGQVPPVSSFRALALHPMAGVRWELGATPVCLQGCCRLKRQGSLPACSYITSDQTFRGDFRAEPFHLSSCEPSDYRANQCSGGSGAGPASPATAASTLPSLLRGCTGNRPCLEGRRQGCVLWADISVFTAAHAHHTHRSHLLRCKRGTANQSMWLFFSFLFNTRVGVFPLQRLCLLGSS